MKGETEILAMLGEVLQKQDRAKDELDARFNRVEARFERLESRLESMEGRVGHMEERFNKVEWRHDDLSLKHEELRFSISQTNTMMNNLLSAVAAMVGAQTQVEARVQRLERPDDFGPQSAVA